ncbi:DUF4352 domain-containing protein [Chloroflexi bacterium TSY]|nr:DUF4352 domain-containing protein [Chloroflexi bacterium TSY]
MRLTLLYITGILLLVACGSGSDAAPIVEAENAQIGANVLTEEWEVTLTAAPYKTKVVGTGPSSGGRSGEWGDIGIQEAEGMWLILPVELTNKADEMIMLTGKFFRVRDAQGTEYPMAPRPVHAATIWNDERWGERENQLPQNPMDVGVTNSGPIIFDVPEHATGLELIMDGTDEAIDLGF